MEPVPEPEPTPEPEPEPETPSAGAAFHTSPPGATGSWPTGPVPETSPGRTWARVCPADGVVAGLGAGGRGAAGAVPHPASPPNSAALGTGSYPHRASSAAPAARPVSTTRPSSHTSTVRTVMFRCVQPCACSTRSAVSTSDATSAAR